MLYPAELRGQIKKSGSYALTPYHCSLLPSPHWLHEDAQDSGTPRSGKRPLRPSSGRRLPQVLPLSDENAPGRSESTDLGISDPTSPGHEFFSSGRRAA